MKRKIFLFIFLCSPILSGCWSRVELQDLAIITAAAIDQMKDGKIRISVQIFIPRAITSGETGEDPSLGATFVREAEGDSLAEAISMLQLKMPRRFFWGHCKVIIFGEELAKIGIRNTIDYLVRHPGPRGNSYLYVSKDEAKGILTLVPPLERYSGKVLKKLVEEEYGMITTLKDVDMSLMENSRNVSLPYIKMLSSTEKSRELHETIPFIVGTAILKNDKLVGTLNMEETRGLLWLKKNVKRATLSIHPKGENGKITMTPTLGKVKYSPQIEGNHWVMNLDIHFQGDIVQNETHLDLMEEEVINDLKNDFEAALKETVAQTLKKLQQEYTSDVINIGRRFHQKYPKEWNKVKNRWDVKFQEVEFNLSFHAKVRRPGYIGPPAALPNDEVKE